MLVASTDASKYFQIGVSSHSSARSHQSRQRRKRRITTRTSDAVIRSSGGGKWMILLFLVHSSSSLVRGVVGYVQQPWYTPRFRNMNFVQHFIKPNYINRSFLFLCRDLLYFPTQITIPKIFSHRNHHRHTNHHEVLHRTSSHRKPPLHSLD